MTVCTGFVWLWRKNSRESAWILKLLLAAAVALTALVLLYMVFPEPIYNLLYPRLSPVAQNYFDYFLPKSYGMCLGGYTFTDYIIFCGIAVCWAKIASAKKRSWKDLGWLGLIFVFGFAILALGRRGELLGAVVICTAMVLLLATPRMRLVLILGGSGLILLFLDIACTQIGFALLDNRLMRFLSAISMNLYIWHQVLAVEMRKAWFPNTDALHSDPKQQMAYMVLSVSVAVLAAMAVTYGLEHPASKRLNRLYKRLFGQ
jgi:hypothetical protein